MRILILSTLALTLNACGLFNVSRHSSHDSQAASSASLTDGTPFHTLTGWTQVVDVYVSNLASDHIVESTINAAERWNKAVGREILNFAGIREVSRDGTLYGSLDDEVTTVYLEKDWKATTGKSDLTLATTVWENDGSSDRIIKGDVILNLESYSFVDSKLPLKADENQDSIVDAESVLVHEFGHLIGLDHVEVELDPDSVMHAKTYIGPLMTSRILSDLDQEHIQTLYP